MSLTEKRCSKCRATKPISGFCRNAARYDGYANYCRECARANAAQWAARNPHMVRALHEAFKKRHPEADREKQRRYRERHPDQVRITHSRKTRDQIRAHKAVHYAVKVGILVRPERCSKCGRVARVQAHHSDYKKQLSVVWMCSSCHKLHHLEME